MRGFEKIAINVPLRVRIAFAFLAGTFFLILLRLWYLQVLQGDYFRFRSENNLLRTVFVTAPRGLILDRHGEVIVRNRPSFSIELVAEDCPDPKKVVTTLAEILDYEPKFLLEKLKEQRKRRRYEPKLILKDVSREVMARVAARRSLLPGIVINVTPARDYIYGDLGAHLFGYIREITREQLESPSYSGYMMGDLVGQYGIEYRWERYLRGDRGVQSVIVNALGTRIGERSFKREIGGHNVSLTIDLSAQRAADEALREGRGGIVALDPNTGEVLALASSPRFNPNDFTSEIAPDLWKDLTTGREKKLSNRVVQGVYPPGSVFKIFMAVAGLAEKLVGPEDRVFCPGYFHFGGRPFRCHKHSGHGSVNLREAMIQSCDVYFYTLGQRLGIDAISKWATAFGLGQLTGLELVEESRGIIPSTAWKKAYFKRPEDQKWYPGETISVAIGQGAVVVSPLQTARALAALVNGGRVLKPYVLKSIHSVDGQFMDDDFKPEEVSRIEVDSKILDAVRESLVGVVNDARGTGRRARMPEELNITVGGKTGTAQSASAQFHSVGGQFEDHAWFAGYAPAENPEIVVVALAENGGHGGVAAAPMVQKVMEAYFRKKRNIPVKIEDEKKPAKPPEPDAGD